MLVSDAQPFNWNFQHEDGTAGLFVAGEIRDSFTGAFLALVPMTDRGDGAYFGKYQGMDGKDYDIKSRVYLDGTYATVDPNAPKGAETVQCVKITASAKQIIIQANTNLQAIVRALKLTGTVQQKFVLQGKVTLHQNIATC